MTVSVPLSSVAEALRAAGLLVSVRDMEDVEVRGVSQDSRDVSSGDLFLAWTGSHHDAHEFVADAAGSGAVAAVVERPVTEADIPQLRVSDGRRAGAVAADRVLGEPWRGLHLVGVTGTNGKTTTAVLTRHLLQQRTPAAALGTLGLLEPEGEVRPGTAGLTTPGPVQLSRWLRELADDGVGAVVVEASSHALDQRRLDGIRFDTAIYTSFSRDHLDYHRDWDAYFAAKARLLGLVDRDGCAVMNADVAAWTALPVGKLRQIGYGMLEGADLRARDVELGLEGSRFRIDRNDRSIPVTIPLLGRFNVENALAAAGAAVAAGQSLEEVADGLERAPQVPGRLEVVIRDPVCVLIDYAHTPGALERVVESLRPLAPGRLTVLFGAGGDRDREKRPLMGRAVAGSADRIMVTSDNPRTEDPDRIIDEIVIGLEGEEYTRITDRREAVRRVLETSEPGETILLSGKGHEPYQEIGTERLPFDERVMVHEWLSSAGTA